jgi:hypothetical protein
LRHRDRARRPTARRRDMTDGALRRCAGRTRLVCTCVRCRRSRRIASPGRDEYCDEGERRSAPAPQASHGAERYCGD